MRYSLDDPPFAGFTGRGITVAILDSGVHAPHPHVGGIDRGISLAEGSDDHVDRLGHGTAVAAAIREKAPAATLVAVKIFDRRLATNADVLARAIEWAADDGARLINLSLGTVNPARMERLIDAVAYAAERGALVVSALEANGVSFFPGALEGVAGVRAAEDLPRDSVEVFARPTGLPEFRASPYPRPIPDVPRERNISGVSFAVANVTGFLARALEAREGIATAAVLTDLARA